MAALITFNLIDKLTQGGGDYWYEPIRDACAEAKPDGSGGWDIVTEHRAAMFLAETLHESNRYRTLVESLKYSAKRLREVFGARYFDDHEYELFAYDEYAIGERVYGGRMGNGPEGSGDGFRYRARGIIGITGKDNYDDMGKLLVWDLVGDPDQLTVPLFAAFASAAWWDKHKCNEAADDDDFEGVTRIIQLGNRHASGRINGMPQRLAMLQEVQEAMG